MLIKQNDKEIIEFQDSSKDNPNSVISKLKLKDYDFYSRTVGISRSDYEKSKLIYDRLGQFKYFDQREEGAIILIPNETADGKSISLQAVVIGCIASYRMITVHTNGDIIEQENNTMTCLSRRRTISTTGLVVYSYVSKLNELEYGSKMTCFEDGSQLLQETLDGISHGHIELISSNGDKASGRCFNGIPFGEYKTVSGVDGSQSIMMHKD